MLNYPTAPGYPSYNPMISIASQKKMLESQLLNLNMYEQQQKAMNQASQNMIFGKVVNNMEEVQSLPFPQDGSCAYYPCPALNKIFVKMIGDNGTPVLITYVLEAQKQEEKKPSIEETLARINERLDKLEGADSNE